MRSIATSQKQINNTPPMGYAIVGAGSFAQFCLQQYMDIENLRLVAVWNRTFAVAERIAKQYGAHAYKRLEDLLDNPDVQIVHLGSTPARHAKQGLLALSKGKHVLSEKPLATYLDDARQMIQLANSRNLQLIVNFVMRYAPIAQTVKTLMDAKILGMPLRGSYINRACDTGLPLEHWFWNEKESGGIFVEHGVHFFDLVSYWLGEGTVLHASRFKRPRTSIVDQVSCEVQHGAQTTVNYYHGFHQTEHFDQQDFRLICERGQVIIKNWIPSDIVIHAVLSHAQIEQLATIFPDAEITTLREFTGNDRTVLRRHRPEAIDCEILLQWKDSRDKLTLYGNAVRMLMQDFMRSIQNPHYVPRITAEDGYCALQLAIQATQVAKEVVLRRERKH